LPLTENVKEREEKGKWAPAVGALEDDAVQRDEDTRSEGGARSTRKTLLSYLSPCSPRMVSFAQ
jgi:hypothetical protein